MAYDEARNKAVLYGGGGPTAPDGTQTREWDGTAWSRPALVASPTGRSAGGLAYDSDRKVTVLYGGAGAPLEPWEWDGDRGWKSSGVSPAAPAIANGAAIAYDRARHVLVLFGGLRSMSKNDFVGTVEWTVAGGFVDRKPQVAPPARHANALVYDVARSRVVMFGGSSGTPLGDLWEWDGQAWKERAVTPSPPPRMAPCATYDPVRKVTVIFGGRGDDESISFNDTRARG